MYKLRVSNFALPFSTRSSEHHIRLSSFILYIFLEKVKISSSGNTTEMRPSRLFRRTGIKIRIQGSVRRVVKKFSSMIRSVFQGKTGERRGAGDRDFSPVHSHGQHHEESCPETVKGMSSTRSVQAPSPSVEKLSPIPVRFSGNNGCLRDEVGSTTTVMNTPSARRVLSGDRSVRSHEQPRMDMIERYVENELAIPFTSQTLKLGESLGSGAMGVVRMASTSRVSLLGDLGGSNVVAVKLVDKGARQETNLFLEYMMLKDLRGLNGIAQSYGVYCGEAQNGIVMEYLCGTSMDSVIRNHGPPSPYIAMEVMKTIFRIMVSMHNRNVAHLDLKPENIMLVTTAESRFNIWKSLIKIADFGVAAGGQGGPDIREILPHPLSGTPGFIAPEVLKGLGYRADKADVWSAGVIMYILFFNKLPYEGESMEAYGDVLWTRGERLKYSPVLDRLPAAKEVLEKCLRVHASHRPTAEEALAILESQV